jgi:hypothetical protein
MSDLEFATLWGLGRSLFTAPGFSQEVFVVAFFFPGLIIDFSASFSASFSLYLGSEYCTTELLGVLDVNLGGEITLDDFGIESRAMSRRIYQEGDQVARISCDVRLFRCSLILIILFPP